MNLNERISKIIEYSELTSSEFADAIDVQRSSISHITSGRNKPSLDFLIKVKEHFPELEWDWLINGIGAMLKRPEPEVVSEPFDEKPKTTALPDLFSLINDENFGTTESEDRILPISEEPKTVEHRESYKSEPTAEKEILNDSQRLERNTGFPLPQVIENEENKLKRIVLFFENGKFESFEP